MLRIVKGGKGDQSGENSFGKHVFANPFEPSANSILALAVMVFCRGGRDSRRTTLFSGSNEKDRFANILSSVVASLSDEELLLLGCERKDIAPYSGRKGAATFANGQLGGPNPVTVQLRMGHSLGKVNDPYLHFSDPQDQLCGRLLALLPIMNEKFGTLPPHFTTSVTSNVLTVEFWNLVVPGYEQLPVEFKPVLPFLLASLIYHENFLRKEFDPAHPIFSSRVFASNANLKELRENVLAGYYECPNTGMQCSGLPPHVMQMSQLDSIDKLIKDFKSEMDTKLQEIKGNLPETISNEVVANIRQSFEINGAVPLTLNDLHGSESRLKQIISSEVQSTVTSIMTQLSFNTSGGGVSMNAAGSAVSSEEPANDSQWWKSFHWEGGRLVHYPVPKEWPFPNRLPLKTMWDLWYFGHRGEGIRPYRLIERKLHLPLEKHKKLYSCAAGVFAVMEKFIASFNPTLLPNGIQTVAQIRQVEADKIFATIYEPFLKYVYGQGKCNRAEDVTYTRIYNVINSNTTIVPTPRKKRKSKNTTNNSTTSNPQVVVVRSVPTT